MDANPTRAAGRKLEVGTYLREWSLLEYRRAKGDVFRFKLERLKHEVNDGDRDEMNAARMAVATACQRLRRAYDHP